jgi:hypothetical protein
MLTAKQCRTYAAESERLGTSFQLVMARKWKSLASGLDRDQLSTAIVSSPTDTLNAVLIIGPSQ